MSNSNQPGKTAPRLLEDLLHYDPRREKRFGRNILTDSPPQFDSTKPALSSYPSGSCRHMFVTKTTQSDLPQHDTRPDDDSIYKLAAVCTKCRYHLDLVMDYRSGTWSNNPCPNQEYPLHHFLHLPEESSQAEDPWTGGISRIFKYQCTARQCPANLRIRIRQPRLDSDTIKLLTDDKLLQSRFIAARRACPDRTDLNPARAIDVLDALATYLRDALSGGKKRRVPAMNRRFMLSFGTECDAFLDHLAFTRELDEETEVEYWCLPQPTEVDQPFEDDSLRTFLEDTREELMQLIQQRPTLEQRDIKSVKYYPVPSLNELEHCLGSLGYEKPPASRKRINLDDEDHPHYFGLGALGDFSDRLLLFAYERQIVCDPPNTPYYFECLSEIAKGRKSEDLEMNVVTLKSQGQISRNDINKAYNYFAIDPRQGAFQDDQHIVGLFQARLLDISPSQAAVAREMLRTLGQARGSQRLEDAASNTIETYEQALLWLGVEETTPDDMLLSIQTVKASESSENKETCHKALEIIAQARDSDYLRSWLQTGDTSATMMDASEAYRLLGVEKGNATDLDVLVYTRDIRIQDHPDRAAEYRQAFDIVAQDVRKDTETKHLPPPSRWPVGLANIGNTCYLNSLLQYLYTVKPLRELILRFDEYKFQLDNTKAVQKMIGGTAIKRDDVLKAIEFATELQQLFDNMSISSDYVVRPRHELAARVFRTEKEHQKIRRRSTMMIERRLTGVGELNPTNLTGQTPLPPVLDSDDKDSSTDNNTLIPLADNNDDSSEGTLVGNELTPDSEDLEMVDIDFERQALNKENETAFGTAAAIDSTANAGNPDAGNSMEGDLAAENSQSRVRRDSTMEGLDEEMPILEPGPDGNPPVPSRQPPPIPPRPDAQTDVTKELERAALQQDVTEALDNVVFQLQCAIRPMGQDANGDQIDEIRSMFFPKIKYQYPKTPAKDKTETINAVPVYVNEHRDIYRGLDDYLDLGTVEIGGKITRRYGTLVYLPPFLQIHINRIAYDIKKAQQTKIMNHLGLDDVIYLDRYTKPDAAFLGVREESWELKRQLRYYEARKANLVKTMEGLTAKVDVPTAAEAVAELLSALRKRNDIGKQIDPELPGLVKNLAANLRKELEGLDDLINPLKAQIGTLFKDLKSQPYRLHAVFMHRGGAGGGHYWINVHDHENDIWRTYSDERVEEISASAVFDVDLTNLGRATPYFIVYVEDTKKDDLVNVLFRNPPGPDVVEVPGTPMDLTGVEMLEVVEGIDPNDD